MLFLSWRPDFAFLLYVALQEGLLNLIQVMSPSDNASCEQLNTLDYSESNCPVFAFHKFRALTRNSSKSLIPRVLS